MTLHASRDVILAGMGEILWPSTPRLASERSFLPQGRPKVRPPGR
jgi:hypothetical protein